MRNFRTVFSFEFRQFFAKTSTKVIMAIYLVIAVGVTFVPTIMNSSFFSNDDNNNFEKSAYVVSDVNVPLDNLKDAKKYDSKEQLEQDIKDDKLEEGIVLTKDSYEYLSKQSVLSTDSSDFKNAFEQNVEKAFFSQNGLNYDQVNQVKASVPQPTSVNVSGTDAVSQGVRATIVYVFSFVIYMTVVQFGSIVATNVVKEKSNRAMELLIVTVNPRTLILGKVFALSLAVLIQMALIVGGLFVGTRFNNSNYGDSVKLIVEHLDYKLIGVGLLFALTGFVMFMFVYAAFASLVSKVEDVNGAITIPMLVFIAAFFVNIYIMGSSGDTKLAEILSYVPFTSYFVMFTRYAISNVGISELAISYAILLATTIILALISVRVYRLATLRYGQKLNFVKILFGK